MPRPEFFNGFHAQPLLAGSMVFMRDRYSRWHTCVEGGNFVSSQEATVARLFLELWPCETDTI